MTDRRAQLRAIYGVDFPEDLFETWAFAQAHRPDAPAQALSELGVTLVGPFDVLAGRFDDVELRYPGLLHWRYQLDLPELFTAAVGDVDGLHWGYWFDDPARLPPVVAGYYANDAFELFQPSQTLPGALLDHADGLREGIEHDLRQDPDYADDYRASLERLDALVSALRAWDFREPEPCAREVVAETPERMGIVVPAEAYRPSGGGARARPRPRTRAGAGRGGAPPPGREGAPGTALLVGLPVASTEARLRAPGGGLTPPWGATRAAAGRPRPPRAPAAPELNVLSYRIGDYADLDELNEAQAVKTLELGAQVGRAPESIADLTQLEGPAVGEPAPGPARALGACGAARAERVQQRSRCCLPPSATCRP
ncbi:MAG: DUF2228 domain-containing protein [Planctomycetota bacterium]